MNKPKVSILTVTFDQDLKWLNQSFRSYTTFCKDYHSYNVVIDDHKQDCVHTREWLKSQGITHHTDTNAKHIPVGYVRQQYMKFYADKYVAPGTEWICHVDSDSIFYESHTPDIYFEDDKPVILYTPYSEFTEDVSHWQKITTDFLKLKKPIEFEFMRRMPLVYPEWLTREMREWVLKTHKITIEEYLKRVDNFTEYNVMGAYCWIYHKDLYHWQETTKHDFKNLPFLQENSHGDFDQKHYIVNHLLGVPQAHLVMKDFIQSTFNHGTGMHKIPPTHRLDYRDPYVVQLYRDVVCKLHPHVAKEWPFDLNSYIKDLQT